MTRWMIRGAKPGDTWASYRGTPYEVKDMTEDEGEKFRATLMRVNEELRIVLAHVVELRAENERLHVACERLGPWMAAALDDPDVCQEMKADIEAWFLAWGKNKHFS